MTRGQYIERLLIQVYGQIPTDDAEITFDLINNWLFDAIGLAAKQNNKENIAIDGISYTNNGFYTTFSGITISPDSSCNLCYSLLLPEIPPGIGKSEGVSSLKFKDSNGFVSQTGVPLNIAQVSYVEGLPAVQNKILFWQEGKILKMKTPIILSGYTGVVRMISGGDASNLDSELNVPPEYFPVMTDYIQKQLLLERSQKLDEANDGTDQP